jgi:hypothetical protein
MPTRAAELRDPVRAKLVALSDALVAAGPLPAPVVGSIVARALLGAYAAELVDADDERSFVRAKHRPDADVLHEPMTSSFESFLETRGVDPARARFVASTLANRLLVALEEAAEHHPSRLEDDAFARALGTLVARAVEAA